MSDLRFRLEETPNLKKTEDNKRESEIRMGSGLTPVARGGSGAKACHAPKAGSSGEEPRATGGFVSNLPHPRVNQTQQHAD